jgi:hypothetical protein
MVEQRSFHNFWLRTSLSSEFRSSAVNGLGALQKGLGALTLGLLVFLYFISQKASPCVAYRVPQTLQKRNQWP